MRDSEKFGEMIEIKILRGKYKDMKKDYTLYYGTTTELGKIY